MKNVIKKDNSDLSKKLEIICPVWKALFQEGKKENGIASLRGLISNDEMMQRFKVSRNTTFTWRKSGELPHIKIGKLIYYWEDDVIAFIECHQLFPKK